MAKGLFFDTSSSVGVLLKISEGEVEKQRTFPCGFQSDSDLVVLIEQMGMEDVSYVGVGVGPGSYTGIRTSAIVAMTLCFTKELPCIALSSLDRLVPEEEGPFIALMDAKRKKAFIKEGIKKGEEVEWTSEPAIVLMESVEGNVVTEGDNLSYIAKICHKKWEKKEFSPIDPLKLHYLQDPYIHSS